MEVRGSGGSLAGFMRPLLLIECNIGSGGGDQCASLPNALDVNVTMYGVADNTSGDQDIEKSKTISLRQNFACQMDAVQNCHQYGATKYLFRCASISCFQVVTK